MITTHKIEDLTFDVNVMLLKVDGHIYRISLEKASSKLNLANEIERGLFKISPSGQGIHWPLIDEDLSIDNLLKISEQGDSSKAIKKVAQNQKRVSSES